MRGIETKLKRWAGVGASPVANIADGNLVKKEFHSLVLRAQVVEHRLELEVL